MDATREIVAGSSALLTVTALLHNSWRTTIYSCMEMELPEDRRERDNAAKAIKQSKDTQVRPLLLIAVGVFLTLSVDILFILMKALRAVSAEGFNGVASRYSSVYVLLFLIWSAYAVLTLNFNRYRMTMVKQYRKAVRSAP